MEDTILKSTSETTASEQITTANEAEDSITASSESIPKSRDPNVQPVVSKEELQSIVCGETGKLQDKLNRINESIVSLLATCKENLDYTQRYQRNTVTILQEQNKEKDKYITGIILVDLLKPLAEVCSKIQRRIRKCESTGEKKFLQDLLDEIEETVCDDYGVKIQQTQAGQARPENIAKVDGTIITNDPTLKNLVAESLCSSWTINERLIQKERVIVYKYESIQSTEANSSICDNIDTRDNNMEEPVPSIKIEEDNSKATVTSTTSEDDIEDRPILEEPVLTVENTEPEETKVPDAPFSDEILCET